MAEQYPKRDRAALVDKDMIEDYLSCLFGQVRYKAAHFINVRGIGEKGTDREGTFQEDCWAQPGLTPVGMDPDQELVDSVAGWARTWGQHNIATYIVPAVMREARGTAQAVELFPAVMVDLDSGDTIAKATYLGEHVGQPTMVVRSGGQTAEGAPKLHLYWVLDEAATDVGRVVDIRHDIAAKAGGDLQFGRGTPDNPYGRAHQPIRIPGTVHSKNDKPAGVELVNTSGPVYELDVLGEAVRRMPPAPWAQPVASSQKKLGLGSFDPLLTQRTDPNVKLVTEVHEGGEDVTRWSAFSSVAGAHIHAARHGAHTLADGFSKTRGWVLSMMKPPWPDARIEREWRALVARDEAKHGTMPAAALSEESVMVSDTQRGLRDFATHLWTNPDNPDTPLPKRKFVVDGLVLAGKPHLLVAEGGAGKTFAALDLCLKVASRREDEALEWMGQPIKAEAGTVVMLTTEDDADELYIRLHGIDGGGRRFEAGDRLIVVPAVNTKRGPFAFAERDRQTGASVMSPGWREFLGWLKELPDLRLVVIDTLNTTLHGDENSATVVNEYARLLAPVCGGMGAALVVTHHIRKQDSKFPIETAEDMMNAVRGSSALPAAFRAVLGIWHNTHFAKVLPALGEAAMPKRLWNLAVLKANNPEMMHGTRHLLRGATGVMEDVTERARGAAVSEAQERRAWLLAAVELAARAGAPYLMAKKDAAGGLYMRRGELHPCLRRGARDGLFKLAEQLVDEGAAVVRMVPWADPGGRLRDAPTLDVAQGPFDRTDPPKVEASAAFTPPVWEDSWEVDGGDGRAKPKGRPTMALPGGAGGVAS